MGGKLSANIRCGGVQASDVTLRSDPQFMNRLRSCCSEYSHKIIMSDWNVHMSNPIDPDYQSMRKLINGESLKLIETGPTHYTGVKDTQIHLLLVDHSDVVLEPKRLPPPFKSRHNIISLQIERFIQSLLPATISYRKYSTVTSANICNQLNTCDWTLFSQPEGHFNVQHGLT